MVNHYELLYLLPATYTEDELNPIKEEVLGYIKKYEGQITFEDNFGKKKLAYPVAKNHQGYYLISEFDLDGAKLKDLEKDIKLTNEVLRHMIVKKKVQAAGTAVKPTLNMDPEPRKVEEKVAKGKKVEKAQMPKVEIKEEDEKDKLKLEDLDDKLDEILEGDIM